MARSPKKVCSTIGLALFAMMLVWLVSMFILSAILGIWAPSFLTSDWGIWILNDAPLYLLAAPVFLLILRLVPDGQEAPREKKPFGFGKYVLAFVFCLGAMYAISMVTNILIGIVDSIRGSSYTDGLESLANTGGPLQTILFGAVVPALGEEFLFRYMLRRKLRGSGDKFYIVFSALCFGLFHANVSQIGYAMVIGMLFAYLYVRTGYIWVPIVLHFIVNTLGMTVVPALSEMGDMATAAVVIGMLVLILGAVVIFCLCIKNVNRQMQPPSEPGWPYTPPQQKWEAEQAAQQEAQQWGVQYMQQPGYGPGGGAPPLYTQPAGYTTGPWQQQQPPPPYTPGGYPPMPGPGYPPSPANPYSPAQPQGYHRPPPIRHSQGYAGVAAPYGGYGAGPQPPYGYAPPPVAPGGYGYPAQPWQQPQSPPWQQQAWQQPQSPPWQQQAWQQPQSPPWQQQAWQPPQAFQQEAYYEAPSYYSSYPQAYAAPQPKKPSAGGICFGNVGMILYVCLVAIMTFLAFL